MPPTLRMIRGGAASVTISSFLHEHTIARLFRGRTERYKGGNHDRARKALRGGDGPDRRYNKLLASNFDSTQFRLNHKRKHTHRNIITTQKQQTHTMTTHKAAVFQEVGQPYTVKQVEDFEVSFA